ncbi:MAG TPA: hypothetical protein VFK84_05195 [Burkholderiales bacterium]|nr:hypothetical protein [Burkholderiales bacterium]
MAWLLSLMVALSAYGQRNEVWSNPALTARGVPGGEQQLMLRQDMSACHGAAFEGTRAVEDGEKRKALGVALFNRCMVEKGWQSREPRRPAPKAAPQISS